MNAVNRGFNRPSVQVISASVTTGYDADGRPLRTAMTEGGASAVTGVPVSGSVAIRFDRLLLPHKVIRQSLCVRPSTDEVQTLADCAAPGQPFAAVEYNPVLRSVFFRLPEGEQLDADTRYRVTLFVTEDPEQPGVFAFDGAPLARRYVFDFQTAADATSARIERLPTAENYCEAQKCFADCGTSVACKQMCRPLCIDAACYRDGNYTDVADAESDPGQSTFPLLGTCAFAQCHGSGQPTDPVPDPSVLAMGMDLFTVDGMAATVIGVTAFQTQTGETSTSADLAPVRFGRAMPRIDPSNPGNSYLIYKMLANPLNHRRLPNGRLADPLIDVEDVSLPLEIDRLRDSVVVGLPMPAQSGVGGPPNSIDDISLDPFGESSFNKMLLIDTWIAHGAVLSCSEAN